MTSCVAGMWHVLCRSSVGAQQEHWRSTDIPWLTTTRVPEHWHSKPQHRGGTSTQWRTTAGAPPLEHRWSTAGAVPFGRTSAAVLPFNAKTLLQYHSSGGSDGASFGVVVKVCGVLQRVRGGENGGKRGANLKRA